MDNYKASIRLLFTGVNKKVSFYGYSTVRDNEVQVMLRRPEFKHMFRTIEQVALLPGVPTNWLIVSINYAYKTGLPRVSDPAEKSINHYDSKAVDIVPMYDDYTVKLPISLNRLFVLQKAFVYYAKNYLDQKLPFPIIAFESNHIHADVSHKPGIAYYNVLNDLLDNKASFFRASKEWRAILDDRSLVYLT